MTSDYSCTLVKEYPKYISLKYQSVSIVLYSLKILFTFLLIIIKSCRTTNYRHFAIGGKGAV